MIGGGKKPVAKKSNRKNVARDYINGVASKPKEIRATINGEEVTLVPINIRASENIPNSIDAPISGGVYKQVPPVPENSPQYIVYHYITEKSAGRQISDIKKQELADFLILRSRHLLADIVHDFTKPFLNKIFTTEPFKMQLIDRILTVYIGVFKDIGKSDADIIKIKGDLKNFYDQCTTDAMGKKLFKLAFEQHMLKYRGISSISNYSKKSYIKDDSANDETTDFFAYIVNTYEAGPNRGTLGFYLDAQFGNILVDYYNHRLSNNIKGINSYLEDLAYEIDPASGWDPRHMYAKKANMNPIEFPGIVTGLGNNLVLQRDNASGGVTATWAGRPPVVITRGTNSVNETASRILGILSTGVNDGKIQSILDLILAKSAGDRVENYSFNSGLWDTTPNRIEISNDILCIYDQMMYQLKPIIETGPSELRLHEYSAVAIPDLSVDQLMSIAIVKNKGAIAGSNTNKNIKQYLRSQADLATYFKGQYESVRDKTYDYFARSFNRLSENKIFIFKKEKLQPETVIDSNKIYDKDTIYTLENSSEINIVSSIIASKFCAAMLTFLIDSITKLYYLDIMEDKVRTVKEQLIDPFILDIGKDVEEGLSPKYLPFTFDTVNNTKVPIELYKTLDFYAIMTQKISYHKLAKAYSCFENDIITFQSISSTGVRYVVYRNLRELLKSNITSDVPVNLFALILTVLLYEITRPEDYPSDKTMLEILMSDVSKLTSVQKKRRANFEENRLRDRWLIPLLNHIFFRALFSDSLKMNNNVVAGLTFTADKIKGTVNINQFSKLLLSMIKTSFPQVVSNIEQYAGSKPDDFAKKVFGTKMLYLPMQEDEIDTLLDNDKKSGEEYDEYLRLRMERANDESKIFKMYAVKETGRGKRLVRGGNTVTWEDVVNPDGETFDWDKYRKLSNPVNNLKSSGVMYDATDNKFIHSYDFEEAAYVQDSIDKYLLAKKESDINEEILSSSSAFANCIIIGTSLDEYCDGIAILGVVSDFLINVNDLYEKEEPDISIKATKYKKLVDDLVNNAYISTIQKELLYSIDELYYVAATIGTTNNDIEVNSLQEIISNPGQYHQRNVVAAAANLRRLTRKNIGTVNDKNLPSIAVPMKKGFVKVGPTYASNSGWTPSTQASLVMVSSPKQKTTGGSRRKTQRKKRVSRKRANRRTQSRPRKTQRLRRDRIRHED
jgi:hypothetical protein